MHCCLYIYGYLFNIIAKGLICHKHRERERIMGPGLVRYWSSLLCKNHTGYITEFAQCLLIVVVWDAEVVIRRCVNEEILPQQVKINYHKLARHLLSVERIVEFILCNAIVWKIVDRIGSLCSRRELLNYIILKEFHLLTILISLKLSVIHVHRKRELLILPGSLRAKVGDYILSCLNYSISGKTSATELLGRECTDNNFKTISILCH